MERREIFGSQWPLVEDAIAEFRRYGIHLSDISRKNIAFEEEDDE